MNEDFDLSPIEVKILKEMVKDYTKQKPDLILTYLCEEPLLKPDSDWLSSVER